MWDRLTARLKCREWSKDLSGTRFQCLYNKMCSKTRIINSSYQTSTDSFISWTQQRDTKVILLRIPRKGRGDDSTALRRFSWDFVSLVCWTMNLCEPFTVWVTKIGDDHLRKLASWIASLTHRGRFWSADGHFSQRIRAVTGAGLGGRKMGRSRNVRNIDKFDLSAVQQYSVEPLHCFLEVGIRSELNHAAKQ